MNKKSEELFLLFTYHLVLAVFASAFYYIFHLFYGETFWQINLRNVVVFKAIGATAFQAIEVYMSSVMTILTAAHAEFLMPRTIIDFMQ